MKPQIDQITHDDHCLDVKTRKMNVYEEANRCLLCQDAPCTKACKTGDPARAIRAIRFDNHKPALRWVKDCSDADLERRNPFDFGVSCVDGESFVGEAVSNLVSTLISSNLISSVI